MLKTLPILKVKKKNLIKALTTQYDKNAVDLVQKVNQCDRLKPRNFDASL